MTLETTDLNLPRHRRLRKPHDSGYTLMELLVVLAILGMLTAIATTYVIHYLDTAKVRTAQTELANIEAGLDLYKLDMGSYPTTDEGLSALVEAPADADHWNGPYVKKAPPFKDPWGRPYIYRSPGQHGDYDIYSYGSKGEPTNGDEKPQIASW